LLVTAADYDVQLLKGVEAFRAIQTMQPLGWHRSKGVLLGITGILVIVLVALESLVAADTMPNAERAKVA
jgi:hypothetical protein